MGNFYMESTQINYRRDDKLKTVDQKLQELSETSAIDTDIAPVFKSTNTYQPGDMVYYRNKLYVFNVEHTGQWAAADVTATDVTTTMNAGLASLKSGLTNVQDDVKLNTQDLTTVSRSKNIVPMTLDNLKAQNTLGTWTGNAYEYNGIVWTINTNSAGQVTSITGNGTASGMSLIELWAPYKAGSYILTGAPADTPASGSYYLQFYANHVVDVKDRGSGVTATLASDANVVVRPIVPDTVQLTNVTFYPMVRLATESDSTFAPYIPSVDSRLETLTTEVNKRYYYNTTHSIAMKGGYVEIDISGLSTGKAYLVMCCGKNNSVWRYAGMLCVLEANGSVLYDLITAGSLTVSVAAGTYILKVTNNNAEHNHNINVKIIG